jgi:imidazolonepropionase-like amidohydrolase
MLHFLRFKSFWAFISCVLLFVFFFSGASAQKTYIQCGRLIDVVSGTVKPDMTIVVLGSQILSIEKGFVTGGPSDQIVDLKSKTVLPGLIDSHVHFEDLFSKNTIVERFRFSDADIAFRSTIFAKRTLLAGFTTVRDCGGSGVNTSLRNAIASGLVIGPYMLSAGTAISATGGHMDKTDGFRDDVFRSAPGPEEGIADGKDELIKAVRFQFKKGADLIKIASTGGVLDLSKDGSGAQFSIEEIKAVVETAKDYGMKVACHAHGAEGIRRAILGGVSSIEHGSYMNEEDFELAKKYGTYLVPTIIAGRSVADSAKIPGYFPPVIVAKAIAVGSQIQATFGKAYKAGVKIAFGTDAGVYAHGKNALEFGYMVEAGMPPMEAIKAATVNAADLLSISKERGSIEPGKMADIIAVEGDPLTDITAMTRVSFVMKMGKVYKTSL